MGSMTRLVLMANLALVLTGCSLQDAVPVVEAANSGAASDAAVDAFGECPVTLLPDPPFVPPSPWPATPPFEGEFWFGTAGLWTALPGDGSWRQLALGEKFWWWSEDYAADDVRTDSTPDLVVTATRLDGAAATFESMEATNGFHPSFNQAMLMGVQLPSPGCWQFEAEFGGSRLSFVVWVPGD